MTKLSTPDLLDRFAQKARRLYTLPAVAAKVLELTESPRVDIRALKTCIEKDPSLATKLLGVVNSSLFGLSRQVSDLNQALALLGVKPLKLLVLGFSLPKSLTEGAEPEALAAYWKHALIKSVAAREISIRFWNAPGDEAFLAALLQDVGVLVLTQDLGEPYIALRRRAIAEHADTAPWEEDALGFHHIALSARLLEHWKLPRSIVRAVGIPHDAEVINQLPENERTTPQILHLAELTAQLLAEQTAGSLAELIAASGAYREIKIDEAVELLVGIEPKIQQLSETLAISFSDEIDCAAIVEQAHAQLSLAAQDAAGTMLKQRAERSREVEEVAVLRETAQRRAAMPAEPGRLPTAAASPLALQSKSATTNTKTLASRANNQAVDDPGLLGRIASGVAMSRKTRSPLSLLMVALNDLGELSVTGGVERVCMLIGAFEKTLNSLCDPHGGALLVGDGQWGVVINDCERSEAVEYARHIVERLPVQMSQVPALAHLEFSVSVGAATVAAPPKNFPAEALAESAQRCLNAARTSGGGFKSLETY